MIGTSIFADLQFQLQGIDSPIEAWEKLNTIFGINNEIQAHQLENDSLTLDPKNFHLLKIICPNLRPLAFSWKRCKVAKEDDGLIYVILAKLGPAYSMFLFTFDSTREAFPSQGIA